MTVPCEEVIGPKTEEAIAAAPSFPFHFCGQPATWRASWSDRVIRVCDDHRNAVREGYEGDHEYDKDGLEWEAI